MLVVRHRDENLPHKIVTYRMLRIPRRQLQKTKQISKKVVLCDHTMVRAPVQKEVFVVLCNDP